ncbi:MAG: phosphoribosylglycinamide formyltransferase-1 [Planctomycetota bacterium]
MNSYSTKLAVLISGGGRSLENLVEHISAGELDARIQLVVSNREDSGGLVRARNHDLPTTVVDAQKEMGPEQFSAAVFGQVQAAGCNLVVLAGFLRFLPIPENWLGRVINIHPSLLPAFGGKGFYGDRVHKAVLARGVKFTGCTVHYVDNIYDNGPILLQRCIEVADNDNVDSLAARVFEEEKIALPQAIAMHAQR